METFLINLNALILMYFLILGTWYGVTMLTAFPDMVNSFLEMKYGNLDNLLKQGNFIGVTVIIPAYNEEKRILETVYSVLNNNYLNTDIIIVSDGSTDATVEVLKKEFELYKIPPIIKQTIKTAPIKDLYVSSKYKNLTVIDKEKGPFPSGADANNCGVNATMTPLYITLDADTILESRALTNMIAAFFSVKDPISIGGTVYILNENVVKSGRLITDNIPNAFIPAFQSLEYLRSFTYGRSGLNALSGSLCHSGAFTLNETNSVREIGGYDPYNFAYDVELTMQLHRLSTNKKFPVKIYFSSTSLSWTTVPNTLKTFWIQRDKWQRGMMFSVIRNIKMFLNPKYGYTGMVVFPAYIFFDLLGPVIEFIAYLSMVASWSLGLLSWLHVLWFFIFAWSYLTIMTISSFFFNLITFNKFNNFKLLRSIYLITVEMFGFRQFRAACCFFGTFHYFFNRLLGKPM